MDANDGRKWRKGRPSPWATIASAGVGLLVGLVITFGVAVGLPPDREWDWMVSATAIFVGVHLVPLNLVAGVLAAVACLVIGSPTWWAYGLIFGAIFLLPGVVAGLMNPPVPAQFMQLAVIALCMAMAAGLLIGRFIVHRSPRRAAGALADSK